MRELLQQPSRVHAHLCRVQLLEERPLADPLLLHAQHPAAENPRDCPSNLLERDLPSQICCHLEKVMFPLR